VSFLDRRGSGRNLLDRGDTPSWRRLVDDVAEYLTDLRARQPNLPVVLLAVSWGGKPAAALQRRHPGLCGALALLCPGFCPRVHLPWTTSLHVFWSRLWSPTKLFPIPLNDPALFTATPRWLEFLRGDALSLHRATARFLFESFRLGAYLKLV